MDVATSSTVTSWNRSIGGTTRSMIVGAGALTVDARIVFILEVKNPAKSDTV